MPQSTQRYLHRAAARTTTGRVRMGLVGSSYEIISGDEGRFHDWNRRSEWWVEFNVGGQVELLGCRNQRSTLMHDDNSVAIKLGAVGDLSNRCTMHHAGCNTLFPRINSASRTAETRGSIRGGPCRGAGPGRQAVKPFTTATLVIFGARSHRACVALGHGLECHR